MHRTAACLVAHQRLTARIDAEPDAMRVPVDDLRSGRGRCGNTNRATDNGSRRWRPTLWKSTLKIMGPSLVRGISATVLPPEERGPPSSHRHCLEPVCRMRADGNASERLDVNASGVRLAVNGGTAL